MLFAFQQMYYAKHWRPTVNRTLNPEAPASVIHVPEGEGLTLSAMPEMEHLEDGVNLNKNIKDERVSDGY